MSTQNKVAIITGGSGGIGRATCLALAAKGINIVVNYIGKLESAKEVVKSCELLGVKAIAVKANVAVESDVENLFNETISTFGRVDILVNNAGITRDNLMMRMTVEDFDAVIDINLKAAFICMKYASKLMMKQRYGRIINVSSVVGVRGNAGQVNYAASKAGLIGMTKSSARELAKRHVTVNAVAPGFIQTDMTAVLSDAVKEQIVKDIPTGTLGDVDDVAHAITFLASDEAKYITGSVLCVDGGMAM